MKGRREGKGSSYLFSISLMHRVSSRWFFNTENLKGATNVLLCVILKNRQKMIRFLSPPSLLLNGYLARGLHAALYELVWRLFCLCRTGASESRSSQVSRLAIFYLNSRAESLQNVGQLLCYCNNK